ncbi:hypothetical protein TURU_053884 [Turdus rufiventris]|nr:hypothetical protein TURU_053884 [Turdus rufiventris]
MRGKQHGDTKVSAEGGTGGAPGARAEIPLQTVVMTMVKQLCPCSPWDPWGIQRSTHRPWGSMGDAEIHPQPVDAHAGAGGCLEEAVIQWETQWRERGSLLPGWSSLSLEACTPGRVTTLQQFWQDCCS